MAIGSLIGDAFGGITNRLQQGFSGIQDRFAEPNPTDYGGYTLEYYKDYINWQGNKDLLAQGISGIPQYKPDFRGAATVGGRRPAGQYASLMAGPQVNPVAGLYLGDPRRRR